MVIYFNQCNDKYVPPAAKNDSGVDNAKEFLNKSTPKFVFNIVPKDYLRFNNNSNMLNQSDIMKAYNDLPKSKDGKLDTARIAAARNTAVDYIKSKNNEACDKINYGVYRENLDSPKLLTCFLGPEVTDFLEKKTPIKVDTRLGFNDATSRVLNNMEKSFVKDLATNFTIKPAHSIRDNIEKENAALDALLRIDISTPEGMMQMQKQYRQITGTNFSCEAIERAVEYNSNPSVKGRDKLYGEAKAFGLMENYTDATKNKTSADGTFTAARMSLSTALGKIQHPAAKIIALAAPTVMLANEKMTEGRKGNELINKKNLTYNNFVETVSQGAVEGVMAQCTFGLGGLGEKLGIARPIATMNMRIGIKAASTKALSYVVKAATPNWEDKSNLLEFVLPSQHFVRSVWGKLTGKKS